MLMQQDLPPTCTTTSLSTAPLGVGDPKSLIFAAPSAIFDWTRLGFAACASKDPPCTRREAAALANNFTATLVCRICMASTVATCSALIASTYVLHRLVVRPSQPHLRNATLRHSSTDDQMQYTDYRRSHHTGTQALKPLYRVSNADVATRCCC